MPEFVGSNTKSETTETSPFFATYGYEPRVCFDLPPKAMPDHYVEHQQQTERLQEIRNTLNACMQWAQAIQKDNVHRKRTTTPNYKEEDKVWVSTRNITTARPSKKLDWKKMGP